MKNEHYDIIPDPEKHIDKSTQDRLNIHGLKLDVESDNGFFCRDVSDTENDIAARFTQNGFYAEKSENESIPVKTLIQDCFLSDHELRIQLNDQDLLYRPVYDIANSGYSYTVTEGDNTGDFNACGYVATQKMPFLKALGIDVMNDEAWTTLDARFNEQLARTSALATAGDYSYSVNSYTRGLFSPKRSGYQCNCDNKQDLSIDVNTLIDQTLAQIDRFPIEVTIEIDKKLANLDIHPLGYINKAIDKKYGKKILFGKMDQQGCTITVKTADYTSHLVGEIQEALSPYASSCSGDASFIDLWVEEVLKVKERKGETIAIDKFEILKKILRSFYSAGASSVAASDWVGLDEYLALLRVLTSHIYGISIDSMTSVADKADETEFPEVPF